MESDNYLGAGLPRYSVDRSMMSRSHWLVLFNVLLFLDNQLQGEIYIIIQICRVYKSFARKSYPFLGRPTC